MTGLETLGPMHPFSRAHDFWDLGLVKFRVVFRVFHFFLAGLLTVWWWPEVFLRSRRAVSPGSKYSLTWHFSRDFQGQHCHATFHVRLFWVGEVFFWKSQVTCWSCQPFGCRLCTFLGGKQLDLTTDFLPKGSFLERKSLYFFVKSTVGEILDLIWPEAWRKWQGAIRVIKTQHGWQGCVGKVYLYGIDWVVSFPSSSWKCRLIWIPS